MNVRTALELGRISNLPTVWTNLWAGMILVGGTPSILTASSTLFIGSFLYVGGMFLNDAFDANIDARERPERPIPRGAVAAQQVWLYGLGMLMMAILTSLGAATWGCYPTFRPVYATVGTAALIVIYDAWHKNNPVAPVLMGLCRVGLYVIACLTVQREPTDLVLLAAPLLLVYVAGITYIARSEVLGGPSARWTVGLVFAPVLFVIANLPSSWTCWAGLGGFVVWIGYSVSLIRGHTPDRIRAGVTALIAGIALLDGMFLARFDTGALVGCVAAFGITRILQHHVSGT